MAFQFANSVLAKFLYIHIYTLQVDYNIWLPQNPNKTNFWGKKSLQELKNTRHNCALQKNKLSPRFQLLNLYLFCNYAIYRANYSEKHQSKSEIFLLWYWPYCWCNPLFGFFLFHGLGRHIMQSLGDFQFVPHRGHLCCRGCHANRKEKIGSRLACVFFSGYFCCYDSERIDLEEIARSENVKL